MKKAIKITGIICVAITVILGIYFSVPSRTLDFRGKVTEIETIDNKTLIYISSSETSCAITADNKTKVSYCCKDDPSIKLSDIKIGDTVEGNYRLFSRDNTVKFITVEYHN